MMLLEGYQGYLLIILFGAGMLGLTALVSRNPRWKATGAGFLVAGRDVPWTVAAPSIAASWIWAPALFVSVQKAYELGVPGIFWFTAPNVFALLLFAWLAPAIRRRIPGGYTLPEWIRCRFNSRRLHLAYLVPYIWYQIMAVCVQIFVGGMMLNYLTGIHLNVVMVLLLLVGLSYSVLSGLRASLVTDCLQMAFIAVGCAVVIPWVVAVTGVDAVVDGLGGLAGKTNPLDLEVSFSFGIVTSIGLVAGAIADQQYWQRAFAVRRRHLVRSFVLGGALFGVVPLALSVLGFLAANSAMGVSLPEGTALPMIGIATVVKLLPPAVAVFFVVMLLAGLCSTLDSAFCAAGSLYSIDLIRSSERERTVFGGEHLGGDMRIERENARGAMDTRTVRQARFAMFGVATIGLMAAFVAQHLFSLDRLWWIFNGVASCFAVPTVLSVFWDGLAARGVFWGIASSSIGMVPFVYGNWVENTTLTVTSAVGIVVINLACCYWLSKSSSTTDGKI